MMKPALPNSHVYRDEIAPILAIGIVVNLVGSFLVKNLASLDTSSPVGLLSPTLIFLDTAGTAFAALVLGPWWAATVGVLSSTLNSFWIADIFAYAVVNVALGLSWGYVARLLNAEVYLLPVGRTPSLRKAVLAAALLILTGVVVSTTFSAAVKITLLERAGGDLFQGKFTHYYEAVASYAEQYGIPNSREVGLWVFDMYRNAVDKSLAVFFGLALAHAIGANLTYSHGVREPDKIPLMRRLRTGGDSILIFALSYGLYLLLSRTILLEVSFTHAPENSVFENWMRLLGVLLFAPFIVSYIAFVFFSYSSGRPEDMAVHNDKIQRETLYQRFRKRQRWTRERVDNLQIHKLLQEKSVYGMLITTAFWPAKAKLPGPLSIWAYVIIMVLTSAAYFLERRDQLRYFVQAREWFRTLDVWMRVKGDGTVQSQDVIDIFLKTMEHNLITGPSGVQRVKSLSALITVNVSDKGWLSELRRLKGVDHVLVVALNAPLTHKKSVADLLKVFDATAASTAVVICRTIQSTAVQRLHQYVRETGRILVVLDPSDLENLIELRARDADPGVVLARARIESRLQIKLD